MHIFGPGVRLTKNCLYAAKDVSTLAKLTGINNNG